MYRSKEKLDQLTVSPNVSIKDAIKQLDKAHEGIILAVNDDYKIEGIFTDPDFRRVALSDTSLDSSLSKVLNRNFVSLYEKEFTIEKAKETLKENAIFHLPILNEEDQVIDVVFETDFFRERNLSDPGQQNLSVPTVIMAGGEGKRLDPFTRVLPKPLIPIGETPVIERIIHNFQKSGSNKFYISIYYRAKTMKAYFEENLPDLNVNFIEEEKPLGTGGALKLMEEELNQPFFLSNCDILIKAKYKEIYKFHEQTNNALTIVGSMKHHQIPYGICKTDNGELEELVEKPEYDLLVNTGMYVLDPAVISYIPDEKKFDLTELIEILLQKGEKVGVFPICSSSWIDIGQWAEYQEAIEELS